MKIKNTVRQIIVILLLCMTAFLIRNLITGTLFKKQTLVEINQPILDAREYKSSKIYIFNLTDEELIYEKNMNEKTAPASLTKIMTSILALEKVSDYNQAAPIIPEIYQEMVRANASMAGFKSNENTIYSDLLYGTLLPSGGECAGSLAVHIGGSKEKFIKMMNDKAKELNLDNTVYKNSVGLDTEGHYTTAKDIGTIFKHALGNEKFREIIATPSILSSKTNNHPEGLELVSTLHPELKDRPQEGFKIIGGKSGTTYDSGLCLVTLAVKNEKEIITVVMGYPFETIHDPGDGNIVETFDLLENIQLENS